MPAIVVYSRFTNRRIKEYAILLPCGTHLRDETGRILRYSQKAAAMFTLKHL